MNKGQVIMTTMVAFKGHNFIIRFTTSASSLHPITRRKKITFNVEEFPHFIGGNFSLPNIYSLAFPT